MSNSASKSSHLDWSYKEFVCFILIYASYEDLELTENEEKNIVTRVGEETYHKMHAIFETSGQYECLQMILDLKPKFLSTAVQKEDLLNILTKHFTVDGEFSRLEKVLLGFLRNLL